MIFTIYNKLVLFILFIIILYYFILFYKFNKVNKVNKVNKLNNNSNIKLIEEIGNGWLSVVYKCKINNIYGIYKIEKLYDMNNYNRQIDFSINFGNKYPDKFLTLVYYGTINNCEYNIIINNDIPKFLKKIKNNINKIKTCSYLAYTPILDGTLDDIINSLSYTEYKKMVNDITNTINLMHENGYYHRDINENNIMYKKNNNNYYWYIIDYESIYNQKYQSNYLDIIINKKNYNNDKIAFILSILNKPILKIIKKNLLWDNLDTIDTIDTIDTLNTLVKYITKTKEFNNIKKYIPINLNNKEINEVIIIITIILHNNIFIESLGLDYSKYKKYDIKQQNNEFLLNLINKI